MTKNIKKYALVSICILGFLNCEKKEIKSNNSVENTITKKSAASSQGGSLAQFTIVGNYLYTVDYKSLKVFDVSNAESPSLINTVILGVGIETIHAQRDYLFIGTNNGVKILSISNPAEPTEESEYKHITSCDPVVTNSNYAVATIRGGTECGSNVNAFDIIDISDIKNPSLVVSTELENPFGLSFSNINKNIIYICDGYSGLKTYDISNTENIKHLMTTNFVNVTDLIITKDNTLIVQSSAGIYQLDGSDALNLKQKSFIAVN